MRNKEQIRGCDRRTFARFHFIVTRLLQAKHGVTARTLAGEFEVNPKTIYRDMDALRRIGVKVNSSMDGYPIVGFALNDSLCPFCKHKTLRRRK